MEQWTKEDVYDEQIAPLMAQIIAICKEHRIPLVAQFNYAATDEDGPSFCTTILPASALDRDDDGQSQRMARAANPPPSFAALTVTSGPKGGG